MPPTTGISSTVYAVAVRTLLASLGERGITCRLDGDRMFIGPPELVTQADLVAIKSNRSGLLDYLRQKHCPNCHRRLDERGRCWPCCERRCSRCPRMTGSAFIELCFFCEWAARAAGEI